MGDEWECNECGQKLTLRENADDYEEGGDVFDADTERGAIREA